MAYALDENLVIAYCNPAWNRFARGNAGTGPVAGNPIGKCVLNSISEPLRTFYDGVYRSALQTGETWQHTYECSTPILYRRFRMQVSKLEGLKALVVTNFLEIECSHSADRKPKVAESKVYLSAEGFLAMCSNCRRVRQAITSDTWDWVPEYLQNPGAEVSHGICSICIHQFLSLV